MKVSRKKVSTNKSKSRQRYIAEHEQFCYATYNDKEYNNPQTFSWADPKRNKGMQNVIQQHYDDMIRTNGIDLAYFRKYNTFFKDGEENHANIIYGEDTTAEYYLSADIRAFLNITKQDFAFNMMGYEAMEEIEIVISIEDFRARFASLIGTVSSDVFCVPVHGDLTTGEYFGYIDVPEFYAEFYGTIPENNYLSGIYPITKERALNSQFFKSISRISNLYPLSGTLDGWLYPEAERGYKVSGVISGELKYHTLNNIEESPGWQLAPQVGDFFRLHANDIEEEYEVNQVISRQLTNENGINPMFGTYVYICKATRRQASQETVSPTNIDNSISPDLDSLINEIQGEEKQQPTYSKSKNNKNQNKMATGIFNYEDDKNSDNTYGGYTPDNQLNNTNF